MRVLTPGFIAAWEGRMLNVHPSILPLFPGLDTHARALAAGMAVHGCTVHEVTTELDLRADPRAGGDTGRGGGHARDAGGAAARHGAPALPGGAAAVRRRGPPAAGHPRVVLIRDSNWRSAETDRRCRGGENGKIWYPVRARNSCAGDQQHEKAAAYWPFSWRLRSHNLAIHSRNSRSRPPRPSRTAEPIPVPEEAPQGSSTPTAVGVGAEVLVAVVLVGLTIFAVGISSLGSGS